MSPWFIGRLKPPRVADRAPVVQPEPEPGPEPGKLPQWHSPYDPANYPPRASHHRVPVFGHTRHGDHPVHAHVHDYLPGGEHLWGRLNKKLAIWIVLGVGSMNCAWIFAVLAIAGLPTALKPGNIGLLFWISSSFLQLTLLSIIIVGQNILGAASDARAAKTFEDAEASRADLVTALDRLDCSTEGGIKTILDALDALAGRQDEGPTK